MSEKHFQWLVQAASALCYLSKDVKELFNGDLESSQYEELFCILDIVQENSRFEDSNIEAVTNVLLNDEITMQQKCGVLRK